MFRTMPVARRTLGRVARDRLVARQTIAFTEHGDVADDTPCDHAMRPVPISALGRR